MTTSSGYVFGVISVLTLAFSPLSQAQQTATTPPAQPATSNAAPPAASSSQDPAAALVQEAIMLFQKKDLDGALDKINAAIKLNPKSAAMYVMRGGIYAQKKMWTESAQDFDTAHQLVPDNVIVKFNQVEIKFMQKQYDAARTGFVALESDPDMGDLASYKVFLCDLFGGHEDVAKKELDTFNAVGSKPSYYYSNAAWSLFHKNTEDARSWLVSALHIYPAQKNEFYQSSLKDLGYLPLPPPPAGK